MAPEVHEVLMEPARADDVVRDARRDEFEFDATERRAFFVLDAEHGHEHDLLEARFLGLANERREQGVLVEVTAGGKHEEAVDALEGRIDAFAGEEVQVNLIQPLRIFMPTAPRLRGGVTPDLGGRFAPDLRGRFASRHANGTPVRLKNFNEFRAYFTRTADNE